MMNIGETIKKLRREKDMTQEQLAEYLNITTQAVSKWETGLSLPDITLVPMLANIFDTSADVLLGVDIEAKEKKIQEIIKKAHEYSSKGYDEQSAEIIKEGLKLFPNSYSLFSELMYNFWNIRKITENAEKRAEITKEVIRLGEKILAECTEDSLRHGAIQILCYTYPKINEEEKALALAVKMPPSHLSKESLLTSIYSGTKRFEIMRKNTFNTINELILEIICNNAPLDNGSKPYSTEELIQINKKVIALITLMVEDGNYGFLQQNMAWKHIDIAVFYAQLNDYDNAVENLKIAVKHSIISDEEYDPDKKYTCLLFRGMKYGGVSHNTQSNDSLHQLEEMKKPVFDPIRERADFIEIEEELKKHAKKH
jgi:Predicted transcriptional regulator